MRRAIVTFINFKYGNNKHDSSVMIRLNKNSISFSRHSEAARWLREHGFEPLLKRDMHVWERKVNRGADFYQSGVPYTDERAILTLDSCPGDEDWDLFCYEGHCEK